MNKGRASVTWQKVIIKWFAFHALFMVAHYAYDWLPNPFTYLIGGVSESVFQHMKIGFFAYGLLNLGEGLFRRKHIPRRDLFWFSRMFSTSLLPLIMLIFFFMAPAYVGHIQNILLEIVYANIILIFTTLVTIIIELQVEQSSLMESFKVVVVLFFVVSLSLYIVFAYKMPWCDVFTVPPGW